MLLIAIGSIAACGGDDEDGEGGETVEPANLSAAELIPDLAELGFDQTVPESIPNTAELDIAFSIYDRTSAPQTQARAEVRVYPSEDIADGDFDAQAEGWKNPPPGLFGQDPGNIDGPALEGLDDAAAYIATNADPNGIRLWTDVFRIGPVIVVAHVLGTNEADVTPVRQAIADSVSAEVR